MKMNIMIYEALCILWKKLKPALVCNEIHNKFVTETDHCILSLDISYCPVYSNKCNDHFIKEDMIKFRKKNSNFKT